MHEIRTQIESQFALRSRHEAEALGSILDRLLASRGITTDQKRLERQPDRGERKAACELDAVTAV